MNSPAYQRGIILYRQRRYAQAAREFLRELAGNPNQVESLAMLALSLLGEGNLAAAEEAAKSTLHLSPDYAFGHFTMAKILVSKLHPRKRFFRWDEPRQGTVENYKLAGEHLREALRLEPRNPDFLTFMGSIESALGRHQSGLALVDQALAIDPGHIWSVHIRQHILLKTGHITEAQQAGQRALEIDPEHAPTHTEQGWTLLHIGEPTPAMRHFSEAMRLNPADESARKGLIEAAKSKNIIYRTILRIVLRVNSNRKILRFMAIVLGLALLGFVNGAGKNLRPELTHGVQMIVITLIVAVLFAFPLFNLIVFSEPLARRALRRHQRASINIVIAVVLLLAVCTTAYFIGGRSATAYTFLTLAILPAIAGTLAFGPGTARLVMWALIGITGLLGIMLIFVLLIATDPLSSAMNAALGISFLGYLFGCFVTFLLSFLPEKR